jgi:excinuclease ABC subunit C
MKEQETERQPATDHLKEIIGSLPELPGVYRFYDKDQKLLYVGKAKNLKKRVSSYFNKEHDNNRLRVLVKQIADIQYIVVETEYDALLLENTLIKKHQPRYNINLRDDKTYPWIVIKNERFPRVFYTRKLIRDGSHYFGPYASVQLINTLLDLIYKLFKLRNCSLVLSEKNIAAKKFRTCIEYDVGNCKGPCAGLQQESDYLETISQIKSILKGNISGVLNHLKAQMHEHAARLEFEQAQECKEKIQLLENYQSKSVVVHPSIKDVDVISILNDAPDVAFLNYLKVANGAIIQSHSFEIRKKLNESSEELLAAAIMEMRSRYRSTAPEVIVPVIPDLETEHFKFHVPKIGDKKHLLELSLKNAFHYRKEKLDRQDKLDPAHRTQRLLEQLKRDLRLKELPHRIECFDNSNFQGDFPVAAMSVFIDAKPARSEYRHFNIKTVTGPDDFASMEEVIYRRYKRLIEEQKPLPQLIVIDGGKGQLSSALNSLKKLGLHGKIAVIGIAKKLEEIYFPGDPVPVYLDKRSESLRLIQRLRDEVHRFGIEHHRLRRSKSLMNSELISIEGIGPATTELLLRHFRSVKKIKEATAEALAEVVGESKARKIKDYFDKKNSNST